MRFGTWVVAGGCLVMNGAACGLGSQDCTAADCSDRVAISVAPESGTWEPGDYTLDLALDGRQRRCLFAMPADVPVPNSVTRLACGDGIEVVMGRPFHCTDSTCEPIEGRYELVFVEASAPRAFELTLRRDDAVLLEEGRELSYVTSRPNGPECGPVCHATEVKLSFAE